MHTDGKHTYVYIHTYIQELLTFRDTHGHCNVPQKYPENPALGAWVAQQRRRYKLLALNSERCVIVCLYVCPAMHAFRYVCMYVYIYVLFSPWSVGCTATMQIQVTHFKFWKVCACVCVCVCVCVLVCLCVCVCACVLVCLSVCSNACVYL